MLTLTSELNTQWITVFLHGTIITVDATMFSWVGQCGDLHLTFLPRKPHPLGWILKTYACAVLHVYIFLKLVQCKDNMSGLEFVAEHKATTGCTLQLVKEWLNTGRIIVEDSWYGYVRTVNQFMKHGLYAVVTIKTCCSGFYRAELLAKLYERFSFAASKKRVPVEVRGQEVDMLAAGWIDNKDMLVLTSCQTDAVAREAEKVRSKFHGGKVIRLRYQVVQRMCHAFYMMRFNTIDILNELALAPGTVTDGWNPDNGVQDELKKCFMYAFAMIETNVYQCFVHFYQLP
jgi:hypothetical protein